MSARRRSPRRSRDAAAEEQQQVDEMQLSVPEDGNDDDAPEEAAASSSSKVGKETRLMSREQRRKRRDGLRSKSVGIVVGKINTKSTSSNKILFGDDFVADQETAVSNRQEDAEEESDDDDDQVEEVKASVAKEQALEQRQQERETATELKKLETSNQRKRKAAIVLEDEPAMDEDFFAQLDVDLDEERKEKKRKATATPKGKHTTFVSKDEKDDAIQVDHNIEVVVLAESSSITANTASGSCGPSEAAMLFSRSKLEDGICTIKKSGGATKTKPLKTLGWKRSSKMNRILLTKNRKNKPASHFVIKA